MLRFIKVEGMARIKVHNEVRDGYTADWNLCFQFCTYNYDDRSQEDGYRIIWRTPEGKLQPVRGQARIPDAATLNRLIRSAESQGWLH